MFAVKFIIKLRHVDIHRHWLRQKMQKSTINIQWIFTTNILIDDFIKILSFQKQKTFVKLIDLKFISISKSKKNNEFDQSKIE